jgi:Rab GDP dissociation inhibitor
MYYVFRFDSVSDIYEPVTGGREDNCYISRSYDATSHFETMANDVLSLYERITGMTLDMNISADMDEEES